MNERRTHARLLACIPAFLESTRDAHDLALIRDVSVRGARLFTRARLPHGEPVHLELYISGDNAPPKLASGKVVRADRRDMSVSDVWPWEIGVEFDAPLEGYDTEIEKLSRYQESIGVLKPKG